MTFKEFLNLGINEFNRKFSSIPEGEPLYNIIKSRTIDINKIKDKEERKYWIKLKRVNKIPDIYLSNTELDKIAKDIIKKGEIFNGNKFN